MTKTKLKELIKLARSEQQRNPHSKLEGYQQVIKTLLNKNLTLQEIVNWIEVHGELKISLATLSKFNRHNGLKRTPNQIHSD